ncbi:MAG: hypothetical protein GY776_05805 [Alteromonas sp.]|nr:hypothetical protein [Alteromonas sp.]
MPWLWKKALDKISKKEIGRIINYLMNDKDQNLPTLTRIQAIRRIGKGNEFKALPKTTSTREVALDALRQARELL